MTSRGRKRALFFDWVVGGHHALYMHRIADSLSDEVTAIFATPTAGAEELGARGLEVIDLGADGRAGGIKHIGREGARIASAETALFRRAIATSGPDVAVHLFADVILRQLVRERPVGAPTAILLFRPRAHYASLYGTPLTVQDRLIGQAYEFLVQRWRRRADARAVLTLDEGAAAGWAHKPGAPAIWFPEPPILASVAASQNRSGAIVYGSLAPRKGLDRLATAAAVKGSSLSLTLAGDLAPSFQDEFAGLVSRLRTSGVTLTLLATRQEEATGLRLLAGSRCAVLPYVSHYGMSRVLLEAAYAGTPVVASRDGLLGHLVTKYKIGASVDTRSPLALREAIDRLCHDDDAWRRCHLATSAFAARYDQVRFRQTLTSVMDA